MSDIMLIGGDGGLEYRLGRFGGDITAIPVDRTSSADFHIRDVLDTEHPPELVVFGPDIAHEDMLGLAESIDALLVPSAMILVADPSRQRVLDAMRVGVRDVIDPNATDDAFGEVLGWARDRVGRRSSVAGPAARQADGRVVVVASPKGGAGKSTVAVNVAVELARRAPSRVVVVDLDLRFGDMASMLDLAPDHSIVDVFASRGGLDTLALKTYLTAHASGLWAVTAPESPAAADAVDGDQVRQLLQVLAHQFTYVVVDTGAGLDEHTLAALEEATDAVFVSSMDVPGVRNMRKEIELLSTLKLVPRRTHLVVNFADKRSGMRPVDAATSIGLPVGAVVPRDPELLLGTNRGVPLMAARKPRGAAAQALRGIVDAVLEAPPESTVDPAMPEPMVGVR